MAQSSTTSELRKFQLSHEGLRLILCSKINEAEDLFQKTKHKGPQLHGGYSFVMFLKSLMTFDEDSMDKAYKILESTEKFCDVGDGVFGQVFKDHASRAEILKLTPHEKLYRKCVVADCLLFEAILAFLRQGITGYVRGGFILRKAWKLYVKIYQETEQICKSPSPILDGLSADDAMETVDGNDTQEDPIDEAVAAAVGGGKLTNKLEDDNDGVPVVTRDRQNSTSGLMHKLTLEELPIGVGTNGSSNGDASVGGSEKSSKESSPIDDTDDLLGAVAVGGLSLVTEPPPKAVEAVKKDIPWADNNYAFQSSITELQDEDTRLRGAVYLGYGLMNLCLSLIPPKLLKVANLLGFKGDRTFGLQALKYVSNTHDMKAPLAKLALLWYHTIIRPFFALDDRQDAGVPDANAVLREAEKEYPDSAIFQYFQGRILYLQGLLPEALKLYTTAAEASKEQREIEHICLYEKGWMHMLQLQWNETVPCFVRLKNETRWSACYYAYLSAIVTGTIGDLSKSRELFLQSSKLVKRKSNNLEKFCCRRSLWYKKGCTSLMQAEASLMTIEVIYLWRALPNCSVDGKMKIIDLLNGTDVPGVTAFHVALRSLLLGATFATLKRYDEAEKVLKKVFKYEPQLKHEKHILSFSAYELGTVCFERKQYERSLKFFSLAKDEWSGYEFEARLLFKVHSALIGLKDMGYT